MTPSPHQLMGSSPLNLSQQNLVNAASSESLPPPPPYLLDTAGGQNNGELISLSVGGEINTLRRRTILIELLCDLFVVAAAAGNVAGAIKALTDLRHTPASPGVLRRAQMLLQNQQQQPLSNNAQVSTG